MIRRKTKLSIEEYINMHGSVVISSKRILKIGDILRVLSDGQGKNSHHPFVVVRNATRDEFLAQDSNLITNKPYFYEVRTD